MTTLRDVAERAGVSLATASRVVTGSARCAPRRASGSSARCATCCTSRPARRGPGAIGLLVPELANPIFPALAQAMETQATKAGLATILCNIRGSTLAETEYVQMLLERARRRDDLHLQRGGRPARRPQPLRAAARPGRPDRLRQRRRRGARRPARRRRRAGCRPGRDPAPARPRPRADRLRRRARPLPPDPGEGGRPDARPRGGGGRARRPRRPRRVRRRGRPRRDAHAARKARTGRPASSARAT